MSELLKRIRHKGLQSKVMEAVDVIPFFEDGMVLAWSGFSPSGDPKVLPTVLADHVEKNGLQGKLGFDLFTGSSIAADIEDRWAELGLSRRRWPYQNAKLAQKGINNGNILMGDMHLSMFPQDLVYGFYNKERNGEVDVAIVEATAITEDGGIVLSAAVGATPEMVKVAKKVIIELNTCIPSFEGLHDVVAAEIPPHKKPYLLTQPDERIGKTLVDCDPEKIVAIVESQMPDRGNPISSPDEISERIADHILDFFASEVKAGRLPANLLPLQSGVGNIANAVVAGLANGPFKNLTVWTEVFQDSMLDLIDAGKLDFATACSYTLTNEGFKRLYDNWDRYTRKVMLRPIQITNHPELVRRLGVIAMNTPVEFDFYGHANSTLINGSRMINGLGGSGDFLRNAYLSIMHSPSTRPSKTDPTGISCVVPFVTHVDQTEHDLNVFVTEQGLADLRGLSPKERAQVVIDKCAHPDYRPILQEYLDRATKECCAAGTGHTPHMLSSVFKMQKNLSENGTMKIDSWEEVSVPMGELKIPAMVGAK